MMRLPLHHALRTAAVFILETAAFLAFLAAGAAVALILGAL